jgi:hypothetical protein
MPSEELYAGILSNKFPDGNLVVERLSYDKNKTLTKRNSK